jgi:hypothetical protein
VAQSHQPPQDRITRSPLKPEEPVMVLSTSASEPLSSNNRSLAVRRFDIELGGGRTLKRRRPTTATDLSSGATRFPKRVSKRAH